MLKILRLFSHTLNQKILCLAGHIFHPKIPCLAGHILHRLYVLLGIIHIERLFVSLTIIDFWISTSRMTFIFISWNAEPLQATAFTQVTQLLKLLSGTILCLIWHNLYQSGKIWNGIWYSFARSSKKGYNLLRFFIFGSQIWCLVKAKTWEGKFYWQLFRRESSWTSMGQSSGMNRFSLKKYYYYIFDFSFSFVLDGFFPSAWRWQVFYHSSSSSQRSYNPFCNGRLKYIICCFLSLNMIFYQSYALVNSLLE